MSARTLIPADVLRAAQEDAQREYQRKISAITGGAAEGGAVYPVPVARGGASPADSCARAQVALYELRGILWASDLPSGVLKLALRCVDDAHDALVEAAGYCADPGCGRCNERARVRAENRADDTCAREREAR